MRNAQPDVFFYEAFAEEAEQLRRLLPPDTSAEFTWRTIQETDHDRAPAAIVSIRTQSLIPQGWSSQLRAILTRSTGFDHVTAYRDLTGCSAPLGFLPLYCNRAVAEQAMLLWMALLRRLPLQMHQFGSFGRDGLTGVECEGKTVLVIGVGNIGHEVTKIARGLGMTVLGIDPVRHWPDVSYTTLTSGLPQADIVVAAMNLTPDNVGYFHYGLLLNAKKGMLLVNIARGELAVPGDLLRALADGILGGIAMDVYPHEPELAVALRHGAKSECPDVKAILELSGRANVICTPHNAFNTTESVARKAKQTMEQVAQFLSTGEFIWPVPGRA